MGNSMAEGYSRAKGVFATLALVCVLGFMVVFVWRVFSYYRQIQAGTVDLSGTKFASTSVSSTSLAALAATATGSGELATKDDPALGLATAPVTVVEFADFGCPYSAEESYVVRALAKQNADSVRFIFRDFPIASLHPGAYLAAAGGGCAEEQNKFWEYHDAVFQHSGEFTEEKLVSYAAGAGLDGLRFQTCLQSGKYNAEVDQDIADGVAAGVKGTPTFFVNGVKIEGDIPFSLFNDFLHAFASN